MDRVNSHAKSYNIPRLFEAIITKLELGWPVSLITIKNMHIKQVRSQGTNYQIKYSFLSSFT